MTSHICPRRSLGSWSLQFLVGVVFIVTPICIGVAHSAITCNECFYCSEPDDYAKINIVMAGLGASLSDKSVIETINNATAMTVFGNFCNVGMTLPTQTTANVDMCAMLQVSVYDYSSATTNLAACLIVSRLETLFKSDDANVINNYRPSAMQDDLNGVQLASGDAKVISVRVCSANNCNDLPRFDTAVVVVPCGNSAEWHNPMIVGQTISELCEASYNYLPDSMICDGESNYGTTLPTTLETLATTTISDEGDYALTFELQFPVYNGLTSDQIKTGFASAVGDVVAAQGASSLAQGLVSADITITWTTGTLGSTPPPATTATPVVFDDNTPTEEHNIKAKLPMNKSGIDAMKNDPKVKADFEKVLEETMGLELLKGLKGTCKAEVILPEQRQRRSSQSSTSVSVTFTIVVAKDSGVTGADLQVKYKSAVDAVKGDTAMQAKLQSTLGANANIDFQNIPTDVEVTTSHAKALPILSLFTLISMSLIVTKI